MAKVIGFKHESASVDLTVWGDGTATVGRLYARQRGLGHGGQLMQEVCTYADGAGLTLVLIAWPFGAARQGLDKHQLVTFYSKFGFEPGELDVLVGTFMVRQPKE